MDRPGEETKMDQNPVDAERWELFEPQGAFMSRTLRLELAKRVQRPSNQMPIRNSRRSRCLFSTGADGVTATDPETLRFKYQLQLHPKNRDVLSKKPHPDLNPVRCRWSPNGRNTDGFGSSYEETRTSGAFFLGGGLCFWTD